MYCPNCGAEYRLGFYRCGNCEVPLVHELPAGATRHRDDPADAVVVFESSVPGETDMVAGVLEEAGILGVVRRSIAGGIQLTPLEGGFTPGQSYALSVPRVAENEAREIIESFRPREPVSDFAEADFDDRQSPSAVSSGVSPRARTVARVLLFMIIFPVGLFVLSVLANAILWFFR
jgi:hypothetical protein